jgi:hypothetical protein
MTHVRATDGAEVWCRDCTEPATVTIETTLGRQYLCETHGRRLAWKLGNTGWNPAPKKETAR